MKSVVAVTGLRFEGRIAAGPGVWSIADLPLPLGLAASIVIAVGASVILVQRYRTIAA